ncbi:PREDICTED: deleted in malignant brain tumors 1 protein-like [Amphimedon queenslandica]|uniref:SRCR domain-containing protein n=1 Tax=Amphimedon queenslandica TaxID=400682 RepID=A0AAN0IWK8_AMPQE|nr:PREDICTED: deleted in malignant brain tumors 1 protein-like [Amphimedon queenslandica]XP_019848943.1 PREDICTED: deleted in malignant brain tumors 1 protein-like [Amphimedon queenslandica]|eukprot:XP_019848942.1 PREDICTED: deleted in malignant brain tumors 1 protein-like [Amphimedon queenslandica]
MALVTFFLFLVFFVSLVNGCSDGSIRLYNIVGGIETGRGLVQYCYSGSWYSVCNVEWDCPEANVACHQLGYFGASTYYHNAWQYFGSNGYTREYYYSCSGSESSLTSCSSYYYYNCAYYSDYAAGVQCVGEPDNNNTNCSESGSVQLTGGATDSEGVLQYCYMGAWVQFCSLGDKEATVACKQLGYEPFARFISLDDLDSWEQGYSPITVSCSSRATESELSSCSVSTTYSYSTCISSPLNCTTPQAIRCYREGSSCTDGSVHLVNGSIYQEGRVEVCVDGVWGSVCSSGWDTNDAKVICKQLGYLDSEPVVSLNGKYGVGDGPIYFSDLSCQGWEHTFTICSKSSYLHFTCSNIAIAGALCTDGCTEGAVRLVGGSVNNEGTVEICHDKLWGLITDAGWDNKDAMVICRQLNFPSEGAVSMGGSRFGKPDRAIHYSFALCNGREQSLSNCNKVTHSLVEGRSIYSNSQAAGVICLLAPPIPNLSCNDKNVPLTRGNECAEGRFRLRQQNMLQYCYKGHWSVLCAFTHKEALVACYQLGYNATSWGLVGEVAYDSTNQSLLQNITCNGTTHSINDCIINEGSCMCQKVISLNCYEPTGCEEGTVRITDGLIENEGRLEVCVGGVWGSVCDDGWDKTDAHVVCQQLGFSELEPEAYYGSTFGVSTGPIVYSNVKCGGWETSLNECAKTNYINFTCTGDRIAGALCVD